MRKRTGSTPVRHFSNVSGAAAAILLAAASFAVPAAEAHAASAAMAADAQGLSNSNAARHAPQWLRGGRPSPAADQLLTLLTTASVDGLDPRKYDLKAIHKALGSAAKGNDRAARKAEQLLNRAFVDYARDLRTAPDVGMQFFEPLVRPAPPPAETLLLMAASARSLDSFVDEMGWMNPTYAQLRNALLAGNYSSTRERDLLRINLARARALPATFDRYVVVNAPAQRLYMYEGGQVVDSMRVVIGKEEDNNRTPMVASVIRAAFLNPYWNVPPDLAAERIAPRVLKMGLRYLKIYGYEVLSDWTDNATVVDPSTIDWQAVADGKLEVRVRQLPGKSNSLGKVKYNFANPFGVYLHDTPDKELLTEETRLFSGGCIRLEDAARFGEWLYGRPLKAESKEPELLVELDRPVPIYVTYMTAVPSGSSIAYLDDVYGWDAQRLARFGHGRNIAAR